jgi:serine/threonine protein phosphatase PrpC
MRQPSIGLTLQRKSAERHYTPNVPDAPLRPELRLRAAGATHQGHVRTHNEDVAVVRDDLDLYLVVDGAGGHNAGEVAAHLAARSIANYVGATVRSTWEKPEFDRFGIASGARRLSAAVLKANRDILEISRSHSRHRGMGATVVAACFSPRSGLMHVAHVGDSRCYRLRGDHLEQLTVDHSLMEDILEQRPELDDTVLFRLPQNVVTRALGMDELLRVSVRSHAVVEGDRYLLCSDGLSGPVPAVDLARVLVSQSPPEATVDALVDLANAAGGPDNISAVVIDCAGGHEVALPASASVVSPMSDAREAFASDPELLILGIEEVEITELFHTASDGVLAALGRLAVPQRQ